MVFQKSNPLAKSIYENVVYGLRVAGIRGQATLDEACERSLRAAALWDEVKDRLDTSGLSLSGGQQQRLCIARAIAIEPEIVLMDEPCSALDPIATQKIEELIQELKIAVHDRDGDAQPAAGRPRLRPDGVFLARQADRVLQHDRGVHRIRRPSTPRTTSPADSANPHSWPCVTSRRGPLVC